MTFAVSANCVVCLDADVAIRGGNHPLPKAHARHARLLCAKLIIDIKAFVIEKIQSIRSNLFSLLRAHNHGVFQRRSVGDKLAEIESIVFKLIAKRI